MPESGNITLTHVKTLVKLQPDEQRAKEAELAAAGNGAKPHAHSRRRPPCWAPPRVKSKKQIQAALAEAQGDTQLRWELEDEDVEPESAPRRIGTPKNNPHWPAVLHPGPRDPGSDPRRRSLRP